jgi:hypothetical protein
MVARAGGPGYALPRRLGKMEIVLARYQRDELHEELVDDAGAVGELTNHIRRGELTLARRLRARFEEDCACWIRSGVRHEAL